MVYGNYSAFLSEYEQFDYADILYDKLELKIRDTKTIKESDFDAFRVDYTYIDVPQYEKVKKMEVKGEESA